MTLYSRENAAERGGVEPDYLVRLVDLGVLVPGEPDRFSPGDVRRVLMAKSLEDAGIPLDSLAAAIQRGALSLDFLDAASYERFTALAASPVLKTGGPTRRPDASNEQDSCSSNGIGYSKRTIRASMGVRLLRGGGRGAVRRRRAESGFLRQSP